MRTSTFALVFIVLAATGPAFGKYSGGTGEPNDPYRIADANDMNEIGTHTEDWGKYFVMTSDINLAQFTGAEFNMIGYWNNPSDKQPFTGVFDGNGFNVLNFTYESNNNHIGLFGYVNNSNTVIKNLNLIAPNVNAESSFFVGSLVGWLRNGALQGCSAQGYSVSGDSAVGGLVGTNDGEIVDCHATGAVTGKWRVGGLAGDCAEGVISDCHAAGNVRGNGQVGGLLGLLDADGLILNSHASCTIDGNDYVGGLVGEIDMGGTISNCYATGNVNGNFGTGGLVGEIDGGGGFYFMNCYASGAVQGDDYTGGFLGTQGYDFPWGEVRNCYAVGAVDGNDYTGGFAGVCGLLMVGNFWDKETSGQTNSDGGIGKTTAEMQTESTFTDAGWDFVEVWGIGENQTYPFLRVYPAGDLNHSGLVDWRDFAILAGHWLEGIEQ
ncbi:MAG: GLUG motif-containing protein [Planctomycetota bacterium]|jgi:hypothetical protein